jgi:hypothetical protein
MRYPTIPLGRCHELAKLLRKGELPAIEPEAIWRGTDESIDFGDLDVVIASLQQRLEQIGTDPSLTTDMEPFEGEVAVAVHSWFDALPVEVLDDPGFWRFVALTRFWWFIEWREAKALAGDNWLVYVDGRRNTEQIPLRLFLRVRAVAATDPDLAKDIEKCTDFWRSHVIRVRTGSAPHVAAAFVELQRGKGRLPTTALRAYAKRLNRTWTNTHLGLYDADRAKALIAELNT